jgi:hypothetical protein
MQKNHRTCLAPCQWPHATTHYTTLREADLRILASTLNSIRCLAQFYRVEEWELQVQAASQSWWRAYERMGLWYFRLLWGGREGTQRQRTRLRNALGRCASWALLVGRGWLWGRASSCHPRGEVRIGNPPQLQLRLLCSVYPSQVEDEAECGLGVLLNSWLVWFVEFVSRDFVARLLTFCYLLSRTDSTCWGDSKVLLKIAPDVY